MDDITKITTDFILTLTDQEKMVLKKHFKLNNQHRSKNQERKNKNE